jgi:hypothetical protein
MLRKITNILVLNLRYIIYHQTNRFFIKTDTFVDLKYEQYYLYRIDKVFLTIKQL